MNYYNENDPKAAAWLRELIKSDLISEGVVDERSIVDVQPAELVGYRQCHFFAGIGGWSYALRLAGVPDDEPVWTGSCPCQPFSKNGHRRGTSDERHLWPAFFNLIRECRPATVFGEQVADKDGCKWLDGIFSDLESTNYRTAGADLCAAGVGAPHIRQRLYWVADTNVIIEFNGEEDQRCVKSSGRVWEQFKAHQCVDSKTRRCSPEAPLLAYGIPFPMGFVRGFGNAIVPQVAEVFIRAYYDVRPSL